ncbi:protein-disulfide reductase DsbD domain-containing protein [Parafilimonas sp.]|uniref:protein-disulfide reductase DsbD domain-containing protein n=1 Tax=Parafilimonas sp. TaxID=1969739 RepID=UPI0039E63D49
MKKFTFTLAAIFIALSTLHAQVQDPVKWNYAATKKSDKEYTITISAMLEPTWHIYSMNTPNGGPVPTTVTFKKNPLVTIDGKTTENGKPKTVHDEIFGIDVKYYGETVSFVQTVKLKSPVKTNLSGTVKYMVCNETMCMPPKTIPFTIQLQ